MDVDDGGDRATEALVEVVLDAARRVHAALGPGLLESVYETVLGHELIRRGHRVARQRTFPVRYGRITIEKGFRADLVVDERVLVEVKSVVRLATVHRQQVRSYLRMSGIPIGLLLNFSETRIEGDVLTLRRSDGSADAGPVPPSDGPDRAPDEDLTPPDGVPGP